MPLHTSAAGHTSNFPSAIVFSDQRYCTSSANAGMHKRCGNENRQSQPNVSTTGGSAAACDAAAVVLQAFMDPWGARGHVG